MYYTSTKTKSTKESIKIFLPSNFFLGCISSSETLFRGKWTGWGPGGGAEGPDDPGPVGVSDEVNNPDALCWIFKAKRTQDAMARR